MISYMEMEKMDFSNIFIKFIQILYKALCNTGRSYKLKCKPKQKQYNKNPKQNKGNKN